MYRTILIEGGDGVGKTTLATHTAKAITDLNAGYEGFMLRFPSNAIDKFREFFLNQHGCRPLLIDNKVEWSPAYKSKIPPLSNLLHVLADFNYAYTAIDCAPDVMAAERRGITPVFVIDREMLSTVVYQILYAFDQGKAEFDHVIAEKLQLFRILRSIVSHTRSDIKHTLLVHLAPKKLQARPTGANTFDLYDQTLIQKYYADVYQAIAGETPSNLRFLHDVPPGETVSNIDWLRARFNTIHTIKAFSKSSEELAVDLAHDFIALEEVDKK